jgi:hypothetical protein
VSDGVAILHPATVRNALCGARSDADCDSVLSANANAWRICWLDTDAIPLPTDAVTWGDANWYTCSIQRL